MIADSFDLALSSLTNPGPTRFSDTAGESNSVIDLMFLQYGSMELDKHTILPILNYFLIMYPFLSTFLSSKKSFSRRDSPSLPRVIMKWDSSRTLF